MARRKQSHPTRPTGQGGDDVEQSNRPIKRPRKQPSPEAADVQWTTILLPEVSSEHAKDVAEIHLLVSTPAIEAAELTENDKQGATLKVRLQLRTVGRKVKPPLELAKQDLKVQLLLYPKSGTTAGDQTQGIDQESCKVLVGGEVDGPDAVIAALAYLIRLDYISLRPAPCLICGSSCCLDHSPSGRLRVLITENPFLISSESFSKRSLWKKAMQILIYWLRPEVVSPTRASSIFQYDEEIAGNFARMGERTSGKQHLFDPSALYDAVMPSWSEPGLTMCFPELLPNLRPYQRRAAFWMVQRERGLGSRLTNTHAAETSCTGRNPVSNHEGPSTSAVGSATTRCFSAEHPLWFSVLPIDGSSAFFFNPYTGAVSLEPHDFVPYVNGGILADEMGLGKTVELLACILANPFQDPSAPSAVDTARTLLQDQIVKRKRERVDCACGSTEEEEQYTMPWIQCDVCDAWQHATCVGYARPAELEAELEAQSKKRSPKRGKRLRSELGQSINGGNNSAKTKNGSAAQKPKKRNELSSYREDLWEDKFVCGACAELIGSSEVNGDCRATLVICPTPILQQWQDEIVRHTRPGSLRVIVYEGVGKGAFVLMDGKDGGGADSNEPRFKVISAHDLAAADIVLATYDTLRTDLSHKSDKANSTERSMRFVKRYPVVPTPLTRLRWWRVCLDEAQMVEGSTTKATEMALLLDAQNRWCVSGTPIQRGLDDLFGLLRFLQVEPFNDYQNWNQALRQPYEAGEAEVVSYMHKFLRVLMWRSTKVLVKDELNLPAQEERLSWLRFSPVEAHFYRQQHEKCAAKVREMIAKHAIRNTARSRVNQLASPVPSATEERISQTTDLGPGGRLGAEDQTDLTERSFDADRPLSTLESSVLVTSLLRLRQACCHPQVGSAGIRSLQQRSPMTMDEILQVLVDKAKIEAEEAQRVLIGALNGLAALAAIDNDIPLAVSIYREALASAEENAKDIDIDPLQKLHALHNLADVMGITSSNEVQPAPVGHSGAMARRDSEGENSNPLQISEATSVVSRVLEDNTSLSHEIVPPHANPVPNLLGSKIPRTLRDDLLMRQCQDIRAKYMASFHAKLAYGLTEFENANRQVSEAKMNCEVSGGTSWWLEVLTTLERRAGGGRDLVDKIRSHLLESNNLGKGRRHGNASSLALLFHEVSGLKYLVNKELDALGSARDQVLENLNSLNVSMKNPTAQDAEQIANCPRDNESMTGSLCSHCKLDDLFQIYENRLLLLRTSADGVVSAEDALIAQHRILAHRRISGSKDPMEVDNDQLRKRRGTVGAGATAAEVLRAPSETEQILSIIKAYARKAEGGHDAATKHLQIFEAWKKEYSQMRALAKIQRDVLFALDELNMATTRLTVQIPGEVLETEIEKLVKLPAEEVPQRNVQLTSEKFDALKDLSRAKGQLRYLKGLSLARQQEEQRALASRSSEPITDSHAERQKPITGWHHNEETCPVCHDNLGSQLMVLPCGHLLCCRCCMVVIERTQTPPNGNSRKCILCPTCRQRTYVGDIALVDDGSERNVIAAQVGQLPDGARIDEEALLKVKGSYGTKIEAVMRRLLWLTSNDPAAKVLIFSTWHEVLDVIEHALLANRITFARVKGTKLNEPIKRFKGIPCHTAKSRGKRGRTLASNTDETVNVLLLPIERGGNGLNLVEAQHVVLVEPLPNPALEAQAINRVHRIGQTRATCVHRFAVNDTVEESVYWLGRSKAELAEKFPGSGVGSRNKGRFALSLNDVTALFAPKTSVEEGEGNSPPTQQSTLSTLTPGAAAAAAAEARLRSSHEVIA